MQKNDAFRDPLLVAKLTEKIKALSRAPMKIMEFCGTHTHAICKFGIRQLLPPTIEMFSGPGCPVCVTDDSDIDYAIALSKIPGVILTTFGDLLKVPGSNGSLLVSRAQGARVETVYSPLDALALAARNPASRVVFLGIGFETTAPAVAASVHQALFLRSFQSYASPRTFMAIPNPMPIPTQNKTQQNTAEQKNNKPKT